MCKYLATATISPISLYYSGAVLRRWSNRTRYAVQSMKARLFDTRCRTVFFLPNLVFE